MAIRMTNIILDPWLCESLEAGPGAVLKQWLVAEGDHVRAGQTLAIADLVHTAMDIPAPHAGIVEEILVSAGENFSRGALLGRLIAI